MTEVVITSRFINETSVITSDKLYERIWKNVYNLAHVPTTGSSKHVPDSVIARYGKEIRTILIAPFLVVHHYDQERNACIVLGLMFQRQAY